MGATFATKKCQSLEEQSFFLFRLTYFFFVLIFLEQKGSTLLNPAPAPDVARLPSSYSRRRKRPHFRPVTFSSRTMPFRSRARGVSMKKKRNGALTYPPFFRMVVSYKQKTTKMGVCMLTDRNAQPIPPFSLPSRIQDTYSCKLLSLPFVQ